MADEKDGVKDTNLINGALMSQDLSESNSSKLQQAQTSGKRTRMVAQTKRKTLQPSDDSITEFSRASSIDSQEGTEKKKDKKLVFLSRSVLQSVRESPMTTGTQIANEILILYQRFPGNVDFKNVQRRVYDALNVLSAMDIIKKQKNHIIYNPDNEFIDDDVEPSTRPRKHKMKMLMMKNSQTHTTDNHVNEPTQSQESPVAVPLELVEQKRQQVI